MDRGSKSKRSDSDSGEGPSTREGTNIWNFEKQRAEEHEHQQRVEDYKQRLRVGRKERIEQLKKFNEIMQGDDGQTKLTKYIEIQERVMDKYQLKDLDVSNKNNANPEHIQALKEINDEFESYLKVSQQAPEINQELSKLEPVKASLIDKAKERLSLSQEMSGPKRVNKEIGQLKDDVEKILDNIDNLPSEKLKEEVLQITLDGLKEVSQSTKGYRGNEGQKGRDRPEQRIKAINQLKNLSKAVSIYKQVHEMQTKFIGDLSASGQRSVNTAGNAFKEFLDSYKQGDDPQDLLRVFQHKHKLLEYEVLKMEWDKQYDLCKNLLMHSEAIDSDEMKGKREICEEKIKKWYEQRYVDKDLYPQDPHFDKGDPHTIAEDVHSMEEWNKKFEDDVFNGIVRKIEKKLSDPLLGLSEKENNKVAESIKDALERYQAREGRAEKNLAEQGNQIIDQLHRLDKNLEIQKDIHTQCKQLNTDFQYIQDKIKSTSLPKELAQDFHTTLNFLSKQFYQLAEENFTEETLLNHQKEINKLNLETTRELDRLLQQAHQQEQNNPDARVDYKQVIQPLQEVKDSIDLRNIKEQLAEKYNSVIQCIKDIDTSKINENMKNFKECVEYFEKNIKTFLGEKKFYTACKLSEELAYRIKMAKSIDDNVFINIDNMLKSIEFRYNDYSRETSKSATLEKKKPNEDAYFADEDNKIYAVFDGVTGKRGGSGGHLASAIAVDSLRQSLARLSDDLRAEDMKKKMKDILFGVHNKITQCQAGNYSEMATTASVVKVMKDGTAVIGNVGDSRVYLLRSGNPSVEQLTLDHAGWVEEVENEGHNPWAVQKAMADAQNPGVPSDQIPKICTDRNYLSITQCLGYGDIRPDIYTHKLNPGDMLIITSDGVHDNLTDENMAKYLLANKSNPKEAADALIQEAKKISAQETPRSKADDITAVVYVHGKGGDVEEIKSERLEEGR
jgi:protein phosphatase